jgi:xanthine dehydrogenase accessory factor
VRLLFEAFTEAERDHLAALARCCDDGHALLLRPIEGGTPLQVAENRKEHRPEWPLSVTRAVREMLSGARPHEPQLVRDGKGDPAWLVEPAARRKHRLYLYGAGHVGRALVRVLQDLPFDITWVDTSRARFPGSVPPHATPAISPDPAAFAGTTPAGAFHIVLTYSHALDLGICHSLLRRGDFGFLGLIGSSTKRARFLKRLSELGIPQGKLVRLVCPIGLPGVGGKEPAAIAVSVAAQLVQLAAAAETATIGLSRPKAETP